MPTQISAEKLQKTIRPIIELREEPDCYIKMTPHYFRLRAISEGKTTYIDQKIPSTVVQSPLDDDSKDFWLPLHKVYDFVKTVGTGDVIVEFPFETDSEGFRLHSAQLTYQFPTITAEYNVTKPVSTEPTSTVTVSHSLFDYALQASDLVENYMRVDIDPDDEYVEFSASVQDTISEVSYVAPRSEINSISGIKFSQAVEINRLRYITSGMQNNHQSTIEISPDYLLYKAEYPEPHAELNIYAAERADKLTTE